MRRSAGNVERQCHYRPSQRKWSTHPHHATVNLEPITPIIRTTRIYSRRLRDKGHILLKCRLPICIIMQPCPLHRAAHWHQISLTNSHRCHRCLSSHNPGNQSGNLGHNSCQAFTRMPLKPSRPFHLTGRKGTHLAINNRNHRNKGTQGLRDKVATSGAVNIKHRYHIKRPIFQQRTIRHPKHLPVQDMATGFRHDQRLHQRNRPVGYWSSLLWPLSWLSLL